MGFRQIEASATEGQVQSSKEVIDLDDEDAKLQCGSVATITLICHSFHFLFQYPYITPIY